MSKIVLYPANDYDFDAADVAAYLAGLTSGVFSSAEDFPVTAAGGLKVTVGAGRGWVHPSRFTGYSITKREADTLTMPLADPSLPRIDRIVMRYDAGARAASLQVLQGTASSTPTAPAISRTELIYDLCLAEITRPAGSTAVTTGQITDTRLDEKLCGLVRDGVTGIPTDELLAAAKERIGELEEKATTSAAAAKDSAEAAKSSETKSAASEKNARTSETNAKASADSMGTSVATCTAKAKEAEASAGKAKTSEGNAKTSEGNAKASENEARQLVEAAKKVVNTDKTLTIDGAPADAKTVGDKFNSIKYAGSASAGGDATRALAVKDYAGSQTIEIGYASAGLTTSNLTHIAGYTDNGTKIKDVSKDVLKRWLGLGSAAYEENTIVRDVGDGRALTFNYSADAVNYNDFTWVPVWINGQMKTVNKNVFSTSDVQSSGSNYIRFGDGTQICWYSINSDGSDYTWSFPVAFSNTEYSVVACPVSFLSFVCKNKSTTSCTLPGTNDTTCYSIAVGRWK